MSTPEPEVVLPTWYQEFLTLFQAGTAHCFLLTGDVHGVTTQRGASQLGFLQSVLHTERRDIVAYYHRAVGITFQFPSQRQAALELMGPDFLPPSDAADPYSVALAATGLPGVTAGQSGGDVFSRARSPCQALAVLEHLLRAQMSRGRVAVILDSADLVCPATSKATMAEDRLSLLATLLYWGNDPGLARQNNPVFLLSPHLADIHPDLRNNDSGYKVIELPLPDEQTRLAYITWYLSEHRRDRPITLLDLTPEALARNTAGLNLRQVEDILLLGTMSVVTAGEHQEPIGVTRQLVKSRKDALIRQQYSETVTILDPLPGGFANLGGMDELIEWTRHEVIAPLREGRVVDVPKGILLVGPPGNGKTRYVEAAAFELGYNALSLRMSSILGGVVGTSERNLQETFDLARALSPTFLFIDEIDQTHLSQRGNHSGSPVAANLFGALLQFMGDEALRGRVMVVGATNRPELLDAALLRPGRFDVIFPVLCPDLAARRSILLVQARLQGTAIEESALQLLATETEKYSAADLEALLKEARLLSVLSGRTTVTLQDAQIALDNLRPITLTTVDAFTRRALEACNNLRFLPAPIAATERERRRLAMQRRQQEHDQGQDAEPFHRSERPI